MKWTDGRDSDMTGVTTDHMYAAMSFSTTSVFHFSDLKTKPANSLLVLPHKVERLHIGTLSDRR